MSSQLENIQEGYCVGERCNREGCDGILEQHDIDGCCSCHTNPPCSYCTTAKEYCPKCGWDGREEQIEYEERHRKSYIASQKEKIASGEKDWWEVAKEAAEIFETNIRNPEYFPEKIEYRSKSHTHFSMELWGMFPKGTTRGQLLEEIRGTFGGRFAGFDEKGCRFRYIAYTD